MFFFLNFSHCISLFLSLLISLSFYLYLFLFCLADVLLKYSSLAYLVSVCVSLSLSISLFISLSFSVSLFCLSHRVYYSFSCFVFKCVSLYFSLLHCFYSSTPRSFTLFLFVYPSPHFVPVCVPLYPFDMIVLISNFYQLGHVESNKSTLRNKKLSTQKQKYEQI